MLSRRISGFSPRGLKSTCVPGDVLPAHRPPGNPTSHLLPGGPCSRKGPRVPGGAAHSAPAPPKLATAAAASAADTGMDVDEDPIAAATTPPTDEHISSFLLHICRQAADVAVDPALGAATTADTDTADGTSRGRKRDGASISGPSEGIVAGGSAAMAADVTAGESAVTADDGAAVILSKKRRRSGGPARAARETAFLTAKAYDATDHRQPMNLGWPTFRSSG